MGAVRLELGLESLQASSPVCPAVDAGSSSEPLPVYPCRGPAPVDPGNSKRGRSRRLGKDYLIRKERLGKNSVVGKLVEKRLNNLVYVES